MEERPLIKPLPAAWRTVCDIAPIGALGVVSITNSSLLIAHQRRLERMGRAREG
jgi:hypothetical protein